MSTSCWGFISLVTKLTHEVDRLGSTVARLKLKGIDGDPHKRWMMWINSMQREKPYLPLTWPEPEEIRVCSQENRHTGAAWLSSARVVRCWVKSRNERNPYPWLLRKGTLRRLPVTNWRKVGMTSSPHGPYG